MSATGMWRSLLAALERGALAGGGSALAGLPASLPQRPRGPLVWFHLAGPGSLRQVAELIRRMRLERRGLAVLVTSPPGGAVTSADFPRDVIHLAAPSDTPAALRGFLDHWQPAVAVLTEHALPAGLIAAVHLRRIPMFLIEGHAFGKTRLWFRRSFGRTRARLHQFERILVRDEPAAQYFRRLGAPSWRLEAVGRMEQGSGALPCTEAERLAMARMFRARPVWLAVAVPEAEEGSVLAALRAALRLSHRLLLILVPEDPARGPALADHLTGELGWSVALRSRDEDPDDEDQIYLADTEGEFGLWYRLAPITYMGGTLTGGTAPRNPFEPAALGSAIIAGPQPGIWAQGHAELAAAGASRMVRNAVDLGEAVSDLLAPDKVAVMAHSAWAVTSGGAEVTDRVMRLLLETLDAQDAAQAFDPGPALEVGRALDTGRAAGLLTGEPLSKPAQPG